MTIGTAKKLTMAVTNFFCINDSFARFCVWSNSVSMTRCPLNILEHSIATAITKAVRQTVRIKEFPVSKPRINRIPVTLIPIPYLLLISISLRVKKIKWSEQNVHSICAFLGPFLGTLPSFMLHRQPQCDS